MPSAHKNNENTNVSRAPGNAAAKQTPPDVLTIAPIARIKNDFKEKFGIPRQSGRARTLSEIVFLPPYDVPEAVRKIEGFSHLWLIFGFSLNEAFAIAADKSDESARKFSPLVRPVCGSKKCLSAAKRAFLCLFRARILPTERRSTI